MCSGNKLVDDISNSNLCVWCLGCLVSYNKGGANKCNKGNSRVITEGILNLRSQYSISVTEEWINK